MPMKRNETPYAECEGCKTLDDCPHAEKAQGLHSAMPPDNCPKPIEIVRHTRNKRKIDRYKNLLR